MAKDPLRLHLEKMTKDLIKFALYLHRVSYLQGLELEIKIYVLRQQLMHFEIVKYALYDSLMDHKLLEELPSTAEAIDVGKRCGAHSKQQQVITDLLCDRARRGKKVIRLKGGDPGIFGRLTEETTALEELQIAYRVIPGISALQAATTGTGMLLTRRDVSRGFVALTPRAAAGKLAPCDANEKSTLPIVYYMSIKAMDHITKELLNDGYLKSTPVAVIYNAGGLDQEIFRTELGDLPKLGKITVLQILD